jgi:hypothetical protein
VELNTYIMNHRESLVKFDRNSMDSDESDDDDHIDDREKNEELIRNM